jgi:hypothetical protein
MLAMPASPRTKSFWLPDKSNFEEVKKWRKGNVKFSSKEILNSLKSKIEQIIWNSLPLQHCVVETVANLSSVFRIEWAMFMNKDYQKLLRPYVS